MAWTSPRTWVAGEVVSAALMNAHLRDNLKALGDSWTSYTPTMANWSTGNGTLTGSYLNTGKLVIFRVKLTAGSTTSFSGAPTFTLPVTAVSTRCLAATCNYFDSSASAYAGGWAFNSSTTVMLLRNDASAALSSTVPFTWATSDELLIHGTYEAA